jgi:hypothetical protein
MKEYDQVVVGVGTSALTFLQGAAAGQNQLFNAGKTLVVGEGELWSKVNKASNHQHPRGEDRRPPDEMGQPLDLLGPIHKTQNPSGGLNNVKVSQYVQELSDLKENVTKSYQAQKKQLEFVQGSVEKVTKNGANDFKIQIKNSLDPIKAKQVIIASGPGPAQTPQEANKNYELIDGNEIIQKSPRPYKEIVSGDEYLSTAPDGVRKRVLVHGSSPTSAWAVAHSIYMDAEALFWLARTNFNDANPAGRNSSVILYASENGIMTVGEVKKITVEEAGGDKPRLAVQFQGSGKVAPSVPLDASFDTLQERGISVLPNGYEGTFHFHQYVYCFGFNPMGSGGPAAILDESIRSDLQPVYDDSKRFGSKPDETVIAYATKQKDLWVVGSTVFREMAQKGLKDCQAKYKRIPDMLCLAGTPPEGVAAVKADIKAVTNMPANSSALNWNLADRQEFKAFFFNKWGRGNIALVTPEKPDAEGNVLKIVDKIIERRTKSTFGWKKEVFNVVVEECTREVLNKKLKDPFENLQFQFNSVGIDDMASFLRERYHPKFNALNSDQTAKAIVKKRRENEKGLKPMKWSKPQFNETVKEFAKASQVEVDNNAIR